MSVLILHPREVPYKLRTSDCETENVCLYIQYTAVIQAFKSSTAAVASVGTGLAVGCFYVEIERLSSRELFLIAC